MIGSALKLKLAPYALALKIGLLAVVFLLGLRAGCIWQADRDAEIIADKDAALVEATIKARAEALRAEQRQAKAIADATDKLTRENADALAERDRTIADLRTGELRLRDKFRCPARVSATPAGPGRSSEAEVAVLSESDQEFLVRLGAEADDVVRQLTACQAVITADRAPLDTPPK